jgi:hypothetical protein
MGKIENLNSVSINKCNCFYIRKYIKINFLFLILEYKTIQKYKNINSNKNPKYVRWKTKEGR